MKRGLLAAMLGVMLSLLACTKDHVRGNGSQGTETRTVNNFTSVSASGSTRVLITQGANFNVTLKGYENLFPYFETRLENNTLLVGYKNNVNVRNDNMEVLITMPVLNKISSSGSGDIKTMGNFSGNSDFEVRIAGSGNIDIQQGSTSNFMSFIAGSGNIYALNVTCEKADISTSGSGNIEITATDELKVKISGSGNVYYKGTPIVSADIAGSGSVIHK